MLERLFEDENYHLNFSRMCFEAMIIKLCKLYHAGTQNTGWFQRFWLLVQFLEHLMMSVLMTQIFGAFNVNFFTKLYCNS